MYRASTWRHGIAVAKGRPFRPTLQPISYSFETISLPL
jgi:hypothetical protein